MTDYDEEDFCGSGPQKVLRARCKGCGSARADHNPQCPYARSKEHRIARLQMELDKARSRVCSLEEQIAAIEEEPDDDYEDGTYLVFENVRRLPNLPGELQVFRKLDGRWYGPHGYQSRWEEVLDLMSRYNTVSRVVELQEIEK